MHFYHLKLSIVGIKHDPHKRLSLGKRSQTFLSRPGLVTFHVYGAELLHMVHPNANHVCSAGAERDLKSGIVPPSP